MIGQLCAAVRSVGFVGSLLMRTSITYGGQQQSRFVSAFNSETADELWKSITMVSKNGRRRGRGKKVNARLITDLYKGKNIGDGQIKMVWPGLNTSVLRGRQMVQQERLKVEDEDPNLAVKAVKDTVMLRRRLHPLDRGFTSVNICGRNLKNTTNITFHEDFDYRVLDARSVCHMTRMFGRLERSSTLVACGNGNGVVGIGSGKAALRLQSVEKASNKAIKKLLFIERHNNHTVLHDFFSQYYATKIFVMRKPEGYGLNCHRVIALLCKLIGIKDIHVKVEGSVMPINITKAFLLGLVRQKKYEDFAEEKKLHVVEFDRRRRNYPLVLASPTVCRKDSEIPTSESLDFKQHALGGRVRYEKPAKVPFFTKLPGWQIHLKKEEQRRGFRQNMWELLAKYGELRSFYADKYPEARVTKSTPKSA